MKRIEEGIHVIHAGAASNASAEDEPMDEPLPEPFASITLVSPGSPADLCVSPIQDYF